MGVYKNTVTRCLSVSLPRCRTVSGPACCCSQNFSVVSVPKIIHFKLFADNHQRHREEAA